MCHRRICDIIIFRGDVLLIRAPQRDGIPQQVPKGRIARGLGSIKGDGPRGPNVRIYVDYSGAGPIPNRASTQTSGRGPLDRTITATALEKIYNEAVAADEREVVLR